MELNSLTEVDCSLPINASYTLKLWWELLGQPGQAPTPQVPSHMDSPTIIGVGIGLWLCFVLLFCFSGPQSCKKEGGTLFINVILQLSLLSEIAKDFSRKGSVFSCEENLFSVRSERKSFQLNYHLHLFIK